MAIFHNDLKALVKENIEIIKKAEHLWQTGETEIVYEIILLPPKERFFQGADPVLVKEVQKITKRKLLGYVQVLLIKFETKFLPDARLHTLARQELFLLKEGIRTGETFAMINEFFPFRNLYAAGRIKILNRFSGRGVGSRVMCYVLDDLKARGIRFVTGGTTIPGNMGRLFKAYGFVEFRNPASYAPIWARRL